MTYTLSYPLSNEIRGNIMLPASKSISNRILILNALSKYPSCLENLSDSDDTQVLEAALNSKNPLIDIGAAGTAMRFLTAYFSQKEGERVLTGSQRMQERPIQILVKALNRLGATITYTSKKGFPPLKISGKKLSGGKIEMDAGISSQYISALMLIAPTLENGLEIELKNNVVSTPYLQMTASLMEQFGAEISWNKNSIRIAPGEYRAIPFRVESDWSAASYWYEIVALSEENTSVFLAGLTENSLQGDRKGCELFRRLGVETEFTESGIRLKKTKKDFSENHIVYDFINEPDLAQAFAVTCCLLDISFSFNGLDNLRIKETNRILALQQELRKLGYIVSSSGNTLEWQGEKCLPEKSPVISTYQDHRMAMAFAPVALKSGTIRIEDPSVVSKSYPNYWKDLQNAGFQIIGS